MGRRSSYAIALAVAALVSSASAAEADRYDPDGIRAISRFNELYAKATAAQRDRQTDEAIGLVKQAMALQPKNPLGALALAELQFMAGRLEEARAALAVADPLTGSRDVRMRTRVLVLRALVAEKTPGADALAAWLEADGWVTEMNVAGPERSNIRLRVEAHEKVRSKHARDEAVKARIVENEAKVPASAPAAAP
jgi:hypothetical protein